MYLDYIKCVGDQVRRRIKFKELFCRSTILIIGCRSELSNSQTTFLQHLLNYNSDILTITLIKKTSYLAMNSALISIAHSKIALFPTRLEKLWALWILRKTEYHISALYGLVQRLALAISILKIKQYSCAIIQRQIIQMGQA